MKKSIAMLSAITAIFFSSCKETQMLPATITKVDGVKISGFSLTGIKGKLKVKIKNPNPTDVTVFRSNLEVKVNDISVGNAGIKRRIVIPANSEVEQELSFKPAYSKMGLSDIPKVIATVKEKKFNVSLKGNLKEGKRFHKKQIYVNVTNEINVEEKIKKITNIFSMFRKKKTAQ